MPHAMRKAIALLVLGLPAAMSFAGFIADPAHGQDASASDRAKVAYPLKASANRRYLVDQENQPFLSRQAPVANRRFLMTLRSIASETASSACSDASKTSAVSLPDTTSSQPTSSPRSPSPPPSHGGPN